MRRFSSARILPLALLAVALLVTSACAGADGEQEAEAAPARPDPVGLPGDVLDACRSLTEEAPALSDEDREQILRDCEGAVTGDEETIRRATEAACEGAALAGAPALLKGQAAEACKSVLP